MPLFDPTPHNLGRSEDILSYKLTLGHYLHQSYIVFGPEYEGDAGFGYVAKLGFYSTLNEFAEAPHTIGTSVDHYETADEARDNAEQAIWDAAHEVLPVLPSYQPSASPLKEVDDVKAHEYALFQHVKKLRLRWEE